jgi:hypothetical protein
LNLICALGASRDERELAAAVSEKGVPLIMLDKLLVCQPPWSAEAIPLRDHSLPLPNGNSRTLVR